MCMAQCNTELLCVCPEHSDMCHAFACKAMSISSILDLTASHAGMPSMTRLMHSCSGNGHAACTYQLAWCNMNIEATITFDLFMYGVTYTRLPRARTQTHSKCERYMCSVPISLVEYEINGVWWAAARSVNNQWPYHRELGDFSFPLPIRITSVAGEVITDVVPSSTGTPLPFLSPPY